MSSQALYRLYDSTGTLLYVGVSLNVAQRMGQHRADKPWWTDVARIELEHHATRHEVLSAEQVAIRAETPRYNVHLAPRLAEVRGVETIVVSRPRVDHKATERALRAAVTEKQAAEADVEEARTEERSAIVAALDAGLRQVDIVNITGWTRETVRRLAEKARAERV